MPKIPQTKKTSSSVLDEISTPVTQDNSSAVTLPIQAPMSREITAADVARLSNDSPYIKTQEFQGSDDYDSPDSWYYQDGRVGWDGSPMIRPQTRVYQIIGRDGKPTGKTVYASSEVQAAALRQETRDQSGNIYIPGARLVDIIYEG